MDLYEEIVMFLSLVAMMASMCVGCLGLTLTPVGVEFGIAVMGCLAVACACPVLAFAEFRR